MLFACGKKISSASQREVTRSVVKYALRASEVFDFVERNGRKIIGDNFSTITVPKAQFHSPKANFTFAHANTSLFTK